MAEKSTQLLGERLRTILPCAPTARHSCVCLVRCAFSFASFTSALGHVVRTRPCHSLTHPLTQPRFLHLPGCSSEHLGACLVTAEGAIAAVGHATLAPGFSWSTVLPSERPHAVCPAEINAGRCLALQCLSTTLDVRTRCSPCTSAGVCVLLLPLVGLSTCVSSAAPSQSLV
jgi:hypothetical protein